MGACKTGLVHDALVATTVPKCLVITVASLLADLGTVDKARTCAVPTAHAQILLNGELMTVGDRPMDPPSEECEFCRVQACFCHLLWMLSLSTHAPLCDSIRAHNRLPHSLA
jgi:hypothetical protein